VQVCFGEVTFSAHGIPARYTAKPPANVFALTPQTMPTI
jgi:hypothetical protein